VELKWLEDYLALVDSKNFTVAASVRHLSQPAFSRRIQALEAWLGVELLDRSKKPPRFSRVAIEHETTLRSLVNQIYQVRSQLQSVGRDQTSLTVAAQHSLLVTPFLPRFLEKLAATIKNLSYSVVSENMETCVARFLKGEVDMLVIYETQATRSPIPDHLSQRKALGTDEMVLVAHPLIVQQHRSGLRHSVLPLLAYPMSSFFGEVVWSEVLPRVLREQKATIVCESSFAVGLREMALACTGAAWLPRSIVLKDLNSGALIHMDTISEAIAMQVVAHVSCISDTAAASQLRDIF
jgi:LysR family transcriptional regulator, hypochlorite-specific transcription factor HypT